MQHFEVRDEEIGLGRYGEHVRREERRVRSRAQPFGDASPQHGVAGKRELELHRPQRIAAGVSA
ncbi:MAG TPA: hypothetical protein VMU58_03645, partial [Gaiellaceae bacterium]|nr:hypothetical protein [Gaiellaceae bacterium]